MKTIHYLGLIACLTAFPVAFTVDVENARGQNPPPITQPQRQLTGLPAQIEEKAKEITVRIDEINASANGSGFIIAKEGNTYTVLTAAHVVKNETSTFEILAPDRKRYPVDSATIKREEGVDLATVQFTSTENYQVATLADYNLNNLDYVFLGGYPKLEQKNPKWRFSAGLIFNKESAVVLEQIINYKSNYYPALSLQSTAFRLSNQLEKALVAINKAIVIQPKDASIYNQKGEILDDLKSYSQAEAAFTQAIQLSPRAAFYNNRGNLYSKQQKWDLALSDYNQAIELNPKFVQAYYNRGILHYDQQKWDLALSDYNQAIELNPKYAKSYSHRGILYAYWQQWESALADFNQAIDINPQYASAYTNRGLVYINQQQWDLALADFNQAIKINPKFVEAYYNRGHLYAEQQKWSLALTNFNQAIALNPRFADAYVYRGFVHYQTGNRQGAIQDLQKAAELFHQQGNMSLYQEVMEMLQQIQG